MFWTSLLPRLAGGEGGIRTPDTRQGMSAFEADRFNHSRTSPRRTNSTGYLVPSTQSNSGTPLFLATSPEECL